MVKSALLIKIFAAVGFASAAGYSIYYFFMNPSKVETKRTLQEKKEVPSPLSIKNGEKTSNKGVDGAVKNQKIQTPMVKNGGGETELKIIPQNKQTPPPLTDISDAELQRLLDAEDKNAKNGALPGDVQSGAYEFMSDEDLSRAMEEAMSGGGGWGDIFGGTDYSSSSYYPSYGGRSFESSYTPSYSGGYSGGGFSGGYSGSRRSRSGSSSYSSGWESSDETGVSSESTTSKKKSSRTKKTTAPSGEQNKGTAQGLIIPPTGAQDQQDKSQKPEKQSAEKTTKAEKTAETEKSAEAEKKSKTEKPAQPENAEPGKEPISPVEPQPEIVSQEPLIPQTEPQEKSVEELTGIPQEFLTESSPEMPQEINLESKISDEEPMVKKPSEKVILEKTENMNIGELMLELGLRTDEVIRGEKNYLKGRVHNLGYYINKWVEKNKSSSDEEIKKMIPSIKDTIEYFQEVIDKTAKEPSSKMHKEHVESLKETLKTAHQQFETSWIGKVKNIATSDTAKKILLAGSGLATLATPYLYDQAKKWYGKEFNISSVSNIISSWFKQEK